MPARKSAPAERTFDQRFGIGKAFGRHEDQIRAWRTHLYALAADVQSTLPDGPLRDDALASLEDISAKVQKAIEEAE